MDGIGDYAYSCIQYIDKNLSMRSVGSPQVDIAAEYFAGELRSFGYEVSFQPFSFVFNSTSYDSKNIIAVKPGVSTKQIIVGAHYDSVGTHGVDDNGSGVSVVLEVAKRIFGVETPFTIVFILFGSEELKFRGSKFYTDSMTECDIANTICMINVDSVFAGTYRYVYSGAVAIDSSDNVIKGEDGKPVIKHAWPFEQAMQVSKEFDLDMRSNDCKYNYMCPVPTVGLMSDHKYFCLKGIPYLCLEASNWEILDDAENPEEGSTGFQETEIGRVMHNPVRDRLSFIEQQWGTRGKDSLKAYTMLLLQMVKRLNPDGLLSEK